MGGISGSKSSQSSSTAISPFQKKYLKDIYDQAQAQSRVPIQQYGGQTVAGIDPATADYQTAALDYAQGGNAGFNQAAGYNSDVLAGKYLTPESNPYLRQTYDVAAGALSDNYRRAILPTIASRFARAGQAQSAQFAGAQNYADQSLARGLSELGTGIYGQAYADERGRQEAARAFAPTIAAEQQQRLDTARSVGEQRQAYQQQLLDDLKARFEFAQDEPALRLSRFANILGNPVTVSRGSGKSQSFGISIA